MTEQDVLYDEMMDDGSDTPRVEAQTEKYMLFVCDNLLFGLPAGAVVEIITNYIITPLPLVPSHVRGVINLRGQIIPIVDIRRFLGRSDLDSNCIIILQVEDNQIGIFVDRVEKMVDIAVDSILPALPQNSKDLVCGMCSLEDGQTMLAFDCAAFLEHT